MANEQNLLKGNPATQFKAGPKQAEIARQGGIASGKAKKREKDIKKAFEYLNNCKTDESVAELERLGKTALAEQLDFSGWIAFKMMEIANNKNVKFEIRIKVLQDIMNRMYGKPVETQQLLTPEGETIKFEYQGLLPATKDLLAKAKADREQLDE